MPRLLKRPLKLLKLSSLTPEGANLGLASLFRYSYFGTKVGFYFIVNFQISKLLGSGDKQENGETPYGLSLAYAAAGPVAQNNLPQPLTSLSDRKVNLEAMLLGFMAEKTLSFAVAPDLLELVKEMSKDRKALNQVTMHRNAAAYKTRFGLSKTIKEAIFEDLKKEFFSLNLDESTNTSNKKVVTVLVNYMTNDGNISTKHLSSFCVDIVNSEAIYQGLVKIFEENNLPWHNLMSVLMDSCNVMRGKNAGVEVKIRSQCPHLLDIDGDSCHHVHNAAKQFSKPFGMHVESLCTDIHNDLKWSPDLRAIFNEICNVLVVRCTMPEIFISFRWLSVYDAAQDLLRLFGALTVFYFSFLGKLDSTQYLHIIVSIYKICKVGDTTRDHIRNLQRSLAAKALTQAGKERKERITKKLFHQRLETQLIAHFFVSVLSQLKEFVKLFQSNIPLIHVLYDRQFSLVRDFLSCFMKAECLSAIKESTKKIKNFDVVKKENHLPIKAIFMGDGVKKLIISAPKSKLSIIRRFERNVLKAYIKCSQTLQKKMPLDNFLLKSVSAIDPACRKHSLSLTLMKGLPNLVTNVISVSQRDAYDLEVHKYHAATLRDPQQGEAIDMWWAEIRNSTKFPLLSKLACALLTCFHGPKVESSFSIMNSVVTSEKNRLCVESFDAIQTIKYEINSQNKSAVKIFKKDDYIKDAVDRNLCKNMVTASKAYRAEVMNRKNAGDKPSINKGVLSKEAAKKISAKAANLQRKLHAKKLSQIPSKSNTSTKVAEQSRNSTTSDVYQVPSTSNTANIEPLTFKHKISDAIEGPLKKQKTGSKIFPKGQLSIKDMFRKKL